MVRTERIYVVQGLLPQLRDSRDELIESLSGHLQDRKLFKCVDIRSKFKHQINPRNERSEEFEGRIDGRRKIMREKLEEVRNDSKMQSTVPEIHLDSASRSAQRSVSGSQSHLERASVRTESGAPMDLRERSAVVDGIGALKLMRADYDPSLPVGIRNQKQFRT